MDEAPAHASLSYWQLVRRRLAANRYGMAGMFGCILIIGTALFAGFLAPYGRETKNVAAIYSPPQLVRVYDGQLTAPFVYGFGEELDPITYETTFEPDPNQRAEINFWVTGDTWSLLGLMEFSTHLYGTEPGKFIHILGTDNLGRDVFSRMLYGTQITLLMGFVVMAAACLLGVAVGVTSGYFSGNIDAVTQRIVEFVKSFPDLPLYLALVALIPRRAEPLTVFILFAAILVLLRWTDISRELRGKVIAIRSMEYVRAAVAVGASDPRIIARHIVPNTSSHIIVWATYQLPEIILLETFLSFLGLGVQAPMVSWGTILNQVRDTQALVAAPWLMAPVGMIVISVLAFNAFGDGLRDAMDPYSNE